MLFRSGSGFGGLGLGVLARGAFSAGLTGEALDASDRIIYEMGTGRLYYDSDGTGLAERIRIATLDSDLALTNRDFLVV